MKDYEKLIKKIEDLKSGGSIDLSMEEDLSIAVMNLISIEEHLFYTAEKTGKDKYFDLLNDARKIRTGLMKKLLSKTEGETWCISKHLLATTMRLIEVGTKTYSNGDKKEAKEIFEKAFETYSMFWAIRLDIIDDVENDVGDVVGDGSKSGVENETENSIENIAEDDTKKTASAKSWTIKDIVKKLVDCCKE